MPPRDRQRGSAPAFGPRVTPQEAADSIFLAGEVSEGLAAIDAAKQVARPIPLADVFPDRRQPRREFPHQVAPKEYTPEAILDALRAWHSLAEEEAGRAFPMRAYFDPPEGWERPDSPGPIERRLIKLVDLAADIWHVGKLIEPIQVSRAGERYRICHGERRWLAHWLIYSFSENETFLHILAHITDRHSVWQQASENGVRSDLNAVSRARQLALLIMDLCNDPARPLVDYDDLVEPGECDRAFYAQVADAFAFRVPRGGSERIARVTGLSASQQRQYRDILRLSDALWQQADDGDMAEGAIRKWLASHRDTVTTVTVSESPPRPFTLKVPARTVPGWQQVKALYGGKITDSDVIDELVKFRLSHEEKSDG